MALFGKVRVGINIDIQRSDGRVHPAVVSCLNHEQQTVTVEWFERGETKGKEVDLGSVMNMNPILFSPPRNNRFSHSQQCDITQQSGHTIDSCHQNDNAMEPKISSRIPTSSRVRTSNVYQQPRGAPPPPPQRNMELRSSQNRQPQQQQQQQLPAEPPPRQIQTRDSSQYKSNIEPYKPPPLKLPEPPRQQQQQLQQQPPPPPPVSPPQHIEPKMEQKSEPHQNGVSEESAGGLQKPGSRRKSNCVKEIERLRKNREDRRAKQATAQENKAQLQEELGANNPNWEFLGMIKDFQSQLEYKPLSNQEDVEDHKICVCVRKRPVNAKELAKKEIDVITIPHKSTTYIHEPKFKVDLTKYLENQQFHFDYSFDDNTSNVTVYKYTAKPLVETIFQGGMATCFAYGQTGSGKTHTMGGDFTTGKNQDCSKGIYILSAADVFKLNGSKYREEKFTVSSSFFEIYSGKVFDLLNGKKKLQVLEDGKGEVNVVGLREIQVHSVEDVLKLIQHGNNVRTSGTTSANLHSSRSHAVFQIILRKPNNRMHGKFSLIDLAGNERGKDTQSSNRQTRMEGAEINKSLLALKECIRALGRQGAHLPFRASKLTQVLRDSFIGEKAKTCMIAMISPGMSSCEHTVNTLRYADRVKELGPSDVRHKAPAICSPMTPIQEQYLSDHNSINTSNSDLALVCTNAEEEFGFDEDMYHFQEAIEHLQSMEEDVLEEHKGLIEDMKEWLPQHQALSDITNEVDYDVEAYATDLESMLETSSATILKLKGRLAAFRQFLREEEEASRNQKHGGPHN